MAQKKQMKAQLQNATKLRLQGLDQIKWQRRKAWQRLHLKWTEYLSKMELWRNSLKTIEGSFGTGIVAYFLFLRWLMFLNLMIFLLIFVFIVLPQIVLNEPSSKDCDPKLPNTTECCAQDYLNETINNDFFILNIMQGTGFMEKTLVFYGMYTNKIFGDHSAAPVVIDESLNNNNNNNNSYTYLSSSSDSYNGSSGDGDSNNSVVLSGPLYYDLPLAYVCVTAGYMLISLIAIVKAASREFKDRLVEGEGQFYQYCNLIFGGWDFCIHNEKSANIKHKAIYNEVKGLLQSRKMEYERNNRSREAMFKLVTIRIVINIFVILIIYIYNK